jgi:hypothetical protein
MTGTDYFVAHRLEYFLPCTISLLVLCATFAAFGWVVTGGGSFADSTGAGVGILIGLATWMGSLTWHVATGAWPGVQQRRAGNRRDDRLA